jgi:hypothetical protein
MKKIIFAALGGLLLWSVIGHAMVPAIPMKGGGPGLILTLNAGQNGVEITTSGSGQATHLGEYTRTEQLTLDPSTGTFTGSIVFTSADGSELYCDLTGGFTGLNTASGTYYFTGGTGRFAEASGEADFNIVQSDPLNFNVIFEGAVRF